MYRPSTTSSVQPDRAELVTSLEGEVRSDEDVTNVLFADGFSTKDEVTEWSGRGVGLGAVRAQCEAVGGRTRVAWSPGLA